MSLTRSLKIFLKNISVTLSHRMYDVKRMSYDFFKVVVKKMAKLFPIEFISA